MDNPITSQKSIKIKKLFVLITIVITLIFSVRLYVDISYTNLIKENEISKNEILKNTNEIKNLKIELENKEKELRKYNIREKTISMYIQEKNPTVSEKESKDLAISIIATSNEFPKAKHTILTSLIESESSFYKNVKHSTKTALNIGVMGMTGVASKIWIKELKEKGILSCANDLNNPRKAIRAGGYILDKYAQNQSLLAALIDYKGNCDLGRRQAINVLKKAQDVKMKEMSYV